VQRRHGPLDRWGGGLCDKLRINKEGKVGARREVVQTYPNRTCRYVQQRGRERVRGERGMSWIDTGSTCECVSARKRGFEDEGRF